MPVHIPDPVRHQVRGLDLEAVASRRQPLTVHGHAEGDREHGPEDLAVQSHPGRFRHASQVQDPRLGGLGGAPVPLAEGPQRLDGRRPVAGAHRLLGLAQRQAACGAFVGGGREAGEQDGDEDDEEDETS